MTGKIGAKEIWATVAITLIGRLVFMDPDTFVNKPGQSAWMMPLMALPIGLLLLLLAKKLGVYGGPVTCLERTLGTKAGRAAALCWSVWLALLMALSVGKMAMMTRYYFFPLTPVSQTAALHVLPMCLIACGGAVCVARSARLLWAVPLIAMIVLVLANIPNLQWTNLCPVFGTGPGQTAQIAGLFSATYWTVLGVWFWREETNMQSPTLRASAWALVFSALLLSAVMLCMTAAIGASAYQNTVSPLYTIASNVDLDRFLQRLGPVFYFCWVVATFVSGAVVLQIAGQTMSRALSLPDYRPAVAGLSALTLAVAVLMIQGPFMPLSYYLGITGAFVTPGLLILLWGIIKIRRLKP